jgi:hypothetical protein
MAEECQLCKRPARPRLARGIGHRGARHEIQRQIVDAELFRFPLRVEHEMPAQQRRSRFGAEQPGQLLVRRYFRVADGQLIFLPFQYMVIGE